MKHLIPVGVTFIAVCDSSGLIVGTQSFQKSGCLAHGHCTEFQCKKSQPLGHALSLVVVMVCNDCLDSCYNHGPSYELVEATRGKIVLSAAKKIRNRFHKGLICFGPFLKTDAINLEIDVRWEAGQKEV